MDGGREGGKEAGVGLLDVIPSLFPVLTRLSTVEPHFILSL